MKLSEALKHGLTLRGEHHQDAGRFCHVEGRGLCSDAWGAAVEAIMPTVNEFNWDSKDAIKAENAMYAFRAVQYHYFHTYQQMPARCPLSQQRFIEAGGRVINHKGEIKLEGERTTNLGGVTSECDLVEHIYGMVDHLFYAHGWSRQQVAEVVEWYETQRHAGQSLRQFNHYQVSGRRINQ